MCFWHTSANYILRDKLFFVGVLVFKGEKMAAFMLRYLKAHISEAFNSNYNINKN